MYGYQYTNIKYGIYDTSGGSFEYIIGNMSSAVRSSYTCMKGSGLTDYSIDRYGAQYISKYIDTYANRTTNTDRAAYNRARLGDATTEVVLTENIYGGGWYSDYTDFVSSSSPWFTRSGSCGSATGVGVFYFGRYTGNIDGNGSTRAALLAF